MLAAQQTGALALFHSMLIVTALVSVSQIFYVFGKEWNLFFNPSDGLLNCSLIINHISFFKKNLHTLSVFLFFVLF